ncbi:hypothetical protein [Maribacter sp. HTCC2170]|uniref:hypothetical protein n=1 Tax=Maribacter sp. (strain HTCC2170 / KCCM 42371) TaxID=313603 RepID=UPI00006B3AEA|nr:hypothetical protein [Maribacter sp. HTCC2170]EAQ99765.1 hypothetical protein FB2170_07414 [Maribacter sp. HTCC2170]
MDNKNVIISEGNRPLWQRIIASLIYTCIIVFLILFFTNFNFTTNTKILKSSFSLLELAIVLLPTALAFSVVRDWHFDLDNKKYKIDYSLGPIGFGKWKPLPQIDYVSVFKQPKENGDYIYEANLWYQKNKHFNILESDNLESVFEMGKRVAQILNVKLLNATIPNAHKWVELN